MGDALGAAVHCEITGQGVETRLAAAVLLDQVGGCLLDIDTLQHAIADVEWGIQLERIRNALGVGCRCRNTGLVVKRPLTLVLGENKGTRSRSSTSLTV